MQLDDGHSWSTIIVSVLSVFPDPFPAGEPVAVPETDRAPQPAELSLEAAEERPHTDSEPPTLEPTVPETQPVTQAEVPNL